MKTKLFIVFLVLPTLVFSQQRRLDYIRTSYQPLMNSLENPDSLFIYSIYSNWGKGIDFFIAFKDSDTIGGYFISNSIAFTYLAGYDLIDKDSLNLITRRVVDTAIATGSIMQLIAQNKLLDFPDENEIKWVCPFSESKGGITTITYPAIEDGSYYRLLKISGASVSVREYYEIYEMNTWCPAQKEFTLWIELDRLFKKYFPDPNQIRKSFIEEYRQRKKCRMNEFSL